MAGPGDDDIGLEVIKDSMGLTDEDLAPTTELDWGDGDDEGQADVNDAGDDEGDTDPVRPQREPFDSNEDEIDRRGPTPNQGQPAQRDPLRQQALKFDPRATFRQDKKGNLVDARTGEIIARAGSEARIYQRVHKQATDYLRAATGNIQNQIQAERGKLQRAVEIGLGFEKELSELRQTFSQINAHELDKSQLIEAAGLFKQAQTDPVGVLKNLLTRAALSGIDISQLGMDTQGFDAKTLMDMVRKQIDEGIQPVRQYTEAQTRQAEEQRVESQYLQRAEREVVDFFGKTPAAAPYVNIFHAVLSQPRFQKMSLGEIWDKVQLHLIRNGVDPSRPPSRNQRQRLNGTQEENTPRVPSRSLPNGQGMAPSGNDGGRQRQNAGPAHPSMSYDAIIREVLGARPR